VRDPVESRRISRADISAGDAAAEGLTSAPAGPGRRRWTLLHYQDGHLREASAHVGEARVWARLAALLR
jgi:hypothetical protein